MKKKLIGILLCTLILAPVLVIKTTAEPVASVQITCNVGIKANITNNGTEPLIGIVYAILQTKFSHKELAMSPGMSKPLIPGESLVWRWIPKWHLLVPFYVESKLPIVNLCTITVKIYENGGDNTIYGEKTVNALYLFGLVILLSEE